MPCPPSCLRRGPLLAVQVRPPQNLCLHQHGCPHTFLGLSFFGGLSRAVVLNQGGFPLRGRLDYLETFFGCHTWR